VVEALAPEATDLPENGCLLARLDSLRDHLDLEAVRQVDDRACEPRLRSGALDSVHEELGHLEPVDREAPEVLERGVAGAEVVDRQADSLSLQRGEPLEVAGADVHQDGLGDLQGETTRVHPGGRQDLGNLAYESGLSKLGAGEIDR